MPQDSGSDEIFVRSFSHGLIFPAGGHRGRGLPAPVVRSSKEKCASCARLCGPSWKTCAPRSDESSSRSLKLTAIHASSVVGRDETWVARRKPETTFSWVRAESPKTGDKTRILRPPQPESRSQSHTLLNAVDSSRMGRTVGEKRDMATFFSQRCRLVSIVILL